MPGAERQAGPVALNFWQRMSPQVQGMWLFLGTLMVFAFYDAFAKTMLTQHSPVVMNLARYLTINVVAAGLLWRYCRATPGASQAIAGALRQPNLWWRSLCLGVVGTSFMTALVTMPLAEATAIYFTAPLLMVWLARRWLGESVSTVQWAAVALGFVGMLLVVRPGNSLPLQGTLLMVLAAACYAVFQLLTRKLAGQVPGPIQFAHMAWICLLVTAFPGWLAWPLTWPTAAQWPVLVAGSLASGLGQLLMLAAYQRASAGTLGPLNYLQLLMAVAISAFWLGAAPDAWAMGGIALIGSAGLYLALRRQ